MNTDFLKLSADDRRIVIEQSALRRNLSPVILEKDFWVCWLLGVLFESEFAGSLVFKGGTALSKVFGLIQRFSEDIEVSLAPEFLGLPIPGETSTQGAKWIEKVKQPAAKSFTTVSSRFSKPPSVSARNSDRPPTETGSSSLSTRPRTHRLSCSNTRRPRNRDSSTCGGQ